MLPIPKKDPRNSFTKEIYLFKTNTKTIVKIGEALRYLEVMPLLIIRL